MDHPQLWVIIALIAGFTICWCFFWWIARDQIQVLQTLMHEGNLIRILTVIFILVAVSYLSWVEKLTPEATTLFSGVAGYVLGGIRGESTK